MNERLVKTSPWYHAYSAGREYLTPEDVQDAIDADGEKLQVWQGLLEGVDKRKVEDPSLAAFIALKFEKSKSEG